MMSQNRQSKIDRIQNDYVSKIILRGEHQTRHINAKMDHLITNQWGRLLEMQEIQVDLLQILQTQQSNIASANKQSHSFSHVEATSANSLIQPSGAAVVNNSTSNLLSIPENKRRHLEPMKSEPFSMEIDPDDHTRNLLSIYYDKPTMDTKLLFSHWTELGDNFYGNITNVQIVVEPVKSDAGVDRLQRSRGWLQVGKSQVQQTAPSSNIVPKVLKRITYDITFGREAGTVTLDDIFAGTGTVKLRNDFDVSHMCMNGMRHSKTYVLQTGRITQMEIHLRDSQVHTYLNGDLPVRYKPSFSTSFRREERITSFWKSPIKKLVITYSPPHQVSPIASISTRRRRLGFRPFCCTRLPRKQPGGRLLPTRGQYIRPGYGHGRE